VNAYDAIVVGLGGMGSAAAAHLAQRGKRVLGLERFALGHELGSSCGRSRIIRKAYFESAEYVPLLLRAYALWRDLERDAGATLLDLTGLILAGAEDGTLIRGVRFAAERYGVPVEEFTAREAEHRFPPARLLPNEVALFEPDGGAVFPERAIAAHQAIATRNGADLRGGCAVAAWRRTASGTARVETAAGDVFESEHLVLTAGPWLAEIARDATVPIVVQRNVQIWFTPENDAYARGRFPAFLLDRDGLPAPVYGFPDFGEGLKAALHGYGETTTADRLDRAIHARDIAAVKDALDAWLPGAAGTFRSGTACMYSLTPDDHFIIDRLPGDGCTIVAGGFSGHGYKFCSVVGEIVADLACDTPRHDIAFLSLGRFAAR
jgi:sarcosine oxidase